MEKKALPDLAWIEKLEDRLAILFSLDMSALNGDSAKALIIQNLELELGIIRSHALVPGIIVSGAQNPEGKSLQPTTALCQNGTAGKPQVVECTTSA